MEGQPLFSYTANFFLTLNMSRPNFKAQALYAATAVQADTGLPAEVLARATALQKAVGPFNVKLVASTQAADGEDFGDARAAAKLLQNAQVRKLIGARYEPKSDGYKRFLPEGKEEYNDADEDEYFVLFERYTLAMNAEEPPFEYPKTDNSASTPSEDATAMLARLNATRKAVDTFESNQQITTTNLTADWRTVAVAEWRLWNLLQDHFAEDPDYRERVYNYFDFSQVQSQGAADEATGPVVTP